MLNIPRILAGLLLSTIIGYLAYRRRSLTRSGWLGAILIGTLTFGFGGWTFGLTLIAFFLSSSLLSHYKKQRKQHLAGEKFEKGGQRDLAQVLANGGAGAVIALLYGLTGEPRVLLALFSGVMATVTADTWGTELGVLAPSQPRSILNFRPVAAGTSGAITLVGTVAGAFGACLIGICLTFLMWVEHGRWDFWLLPAALIGGVGGSFADSLLGATAQVMYRTAHGDETERIYNTDGSANQRVRGWHWMNNDAVNVLSSLAGAGIALLVAVLANV